MSHFKKSPKDTDMDMIFSCPSQRVLDVSDNCTELMLPKKLIANVNYFCYDF